MTCYWWLKKGLGTEVVKQHIGMLKQIINIWKSTIKTLYIENLGANNLYGGGNVSKIACMRKITLN